MNAIIGKKLLKINVYRQPNKECPLHAPFSPLLDDEYSLKTTKKGERYKCNYKSHHEFLNVISSISIIRISTEEINQKQFINFCHMYHNIIILVIVIDF